MSRRASSSASNLWYEIPTPSSLSRKALALAEMHEAAAHSLRRVFEPARPALTVLQGIRP